MQTRDFQYHVPDELIAQHPGKKRTASRMLAVDRKTGVFTDSHFTSLYNYLRPGDCLVLNNTRVIPARMYGRKTSGGKLEVLIERLINPKRALAHIRCSKSPRTGCLIHIHANPGSRTGSEYASRQSEEAHMLYVVARQDDLFLIESAADDLADIIQQCGHIPLPPYISRTDEAIDLERYQTVYAKQPGAVAAPTAGLHFDEPLLERLAQNGVDSAYVTLHIGAGTFQPVRVDNIEDHRMHSEYLEVPQETVDKCRNARQRGGRIVAIGTTAVRSLESASSGGELVAFNGETDIFIYPGYRFSSVDALLTNFHLPESTLLMLVCAFAGYDTTMAAYRHAVERRYRFFSYGDAMFIE